MTRYETPLDFDHTCLPGCPCPNGARSVETVAVIWRNIGWAAEGPISTCIGWHSHPALEIEGHMHQDGESPHTHRPKVEWDMKPSPIEQVGGR